jgi:trk system potassium uptake protein TrkA/voltage-gated potassium channel
MRIWNSPARNLLAGIAFVLAVAAFAITGYMYHGWSFGDALYMAVMTVFTVGYGEVHPIDTPGLRALTIALIVMGCTGMIFVTGALVQLITAASIQQALGVRRMSTEISKLTGHVIVCGFGRTGQMLARELHAGRARFLIVERSEQRFGQARQAGYLAMQADATDEEVLLRAGVKRARVLATVLPDDAANVFITLSARSLSSDITIIARGEAPATETKLKHAGANQVVLPAHIGAERIAELILYPAASKPGREAQVDVDLRALGLDREVVIAESMGFAGLTVAQAEHRGGHAFFIVGIERQGSDEIPEVAPDTIIGEGDGVVLVGRGGRAGMLAVFGQPPPS